jgi:hypothetical protein
MKDLPLYILLWIIFIGTGACAILSLYVMRKFRWLFFIAFMSVAGFIGYGLYVQHEDVAIFHKK